MSKKFKLTMLSIILTIVCGIIAIFPIIKVEASLLEPVNTEISFSGDYNDYTDSTYYFDSETGMEDKTKNLMDYPEYFAERFIHKNIPDDPADDWIEGFIPKDVFINEGSTFCLGKEYSFIAVNNGENIFIVFLEVKIDVNSLTDGTIEFKISPMFNYVYRYDSVHDVVRPKIYYDSPSKSYSKSINGLSYHLKDISSAAYLQNISYANFGDEGYSSNDDNGAFFTSTHYYYSGVSKKNSKEILSDSANVFAYALGLAFGPFGLAATKVIDSIVDAVEAGYIVLNNELNKNAYRVAKTNDEFNSELFHTTKQSQLLAQAQGDTRYKYGLIKNSISYIETTDKNPLLINTDNSEHYVKNMYRISTTDHERTRMVTKFCANYVQENSVGSITYHGRNIESNDIIIDFWGENEKEDIKVGDTKTCYILSDGSKRYSFTPEQSAKYEFCAPERDIVMYGENGEAVVSGRDKISHSMQAGKEYVFEVAGTDANTITPVCLNIVYENIEYNQEKTVALLPFHTEYFIFDAVETKLYLLDFAEPPSVDIEYQVSGEEQWHTFADARYPMFCESGKTYHIRIVNYVEQTLDIPIKIVSPPEYDENLNFNGNTSDVGYFLLQTTFNSNFKINIKSAKTSEMTLFDASFNQLAKVTSENISYPIAAASDEVFYIKVDAGYDGTSDYNLNVEFSPQLLVFGTNNIVTVKGSNIVRFAPEITGKYELTSNGTITVFDSDGNLKTDNVFLENEDYYITVKHNGTAALNVGVQSTEISANQDYTLDAAQNTFEMFAFTASFSGVHEIWGDVTVKIYDSNMNLCISGKSVSLVKDKFYYIYVCDFDETVFGIRFAPSVILPNQFYYIARAAFYELTVEAGDNYSFEISDNPTNSIVVCDVNGNVLTQTTNAASCFLSEGKYYIENRGSDRNISLKISNGDFDAGQSVLVDSYNAVSRLCGTLDTEVRYTFLCQNTATYVLIAESSAGLEIVDADTREIVTSNADGGIWTKKYSVFLTAGKNYIFKFYSDKLDTLNVQFYVPGNMDRSEFSVKYGNKIISDGILAYGKTYSVLLRSASDNDYITEDSVLCDISLNGKPADSSLVSFEYNSREIVFTLAREQNLAGAELIIDIYYGIDDTNFDENRRKHTDLMFVLSAPYEFGLKVVDEYLVVPEINSVLDGKISEMGSGEYVKFRFYDFRNDSYESQPFYETYNDGLSEFDTVGLNNFDQIKIVAEFKYDGYIGEVVTYLDCYDNKATGFSALGDVKKVILDLTGAGPSGRFIYISSEVEVLNIFGAVGVNYSDTCLYIKNDRETPLKISLNDFSFNCKSSSAVYYEGGQRITLNAEGKVEISSSGVRYINTVEVKKLTITGTKMTVRGSEQAMHFDPGGTAIKCEVLSVGITLLECYGGNVWNSLADMPQGKNGGHGGHGIETVNFYLLSGGGVVSYGGKGGNGSDGLNGTAGANGLNHNGEKDNTVTTSGNGGANGVDGGNGGDGGHGLKMTGNIEIMSGSKTLILQGGDGGSGADGGAGGNGGKGGSELLRQANKAPQDGKAGGSGGHGGSGGRGGNGGYGLYSEKYPTNLKAAANTQIGGGNGGNAGNGGNGGNGGAGGDGGDGNPKLLHAINTEDGSNGGMGGHGGMGGVGGAAGQGRNACNFSLVISSINQSSGVSGAGGRGGIGGNGGNGGDGGDSKRGEPGVGGYGGKGGYGFDANGYGIYAPNGENGSDGKEL